MSEQFSQEPTKVSYERIDGESYWIMSDGSRIKAEKPTVPIKLKKPAPQTGLEQSPVFAGFSRNYGELARIASNSADIYRSGEVGTGDKTEDNARILDGAAEDFKTQDEAHQAYLQGRHGDMYQRPAED